MGKNLQQIVAAGVLLFGLSTPAYGAGITETDTWLTHARGYVGANMWITEYEINPNEIFPGQKLQYSFAELAPGGLNILL